jgi:hypothetical protein
MKALKWIAGMVLFAGVSGWKYQAGRRKKRLNQGKTTKKMPEQQ